MAQRESNTEALTAAIVAGDEALAARLVDKGADVNAKSSRDAAPLLSALLHNRPRLFELLVARGAKVNVRHGKFNLLLALASRKGKGVRFVSRLVELGVDPNFIGDDTTPVLQAVRVGNLRFLDELLKLPSLDTESRHYETAIAWARNTKQRAVATALVARQKSGVQAARSAKKKVASTKKEAVAKRARKTPVAKAVAKKAVARKAVAKKAVAKKAVAKKAVAKKAVAKKAVAKKAVAKKAVTKKAVTKKAVTKKAVTKKAVTKKAVAKKAVAKKKTRSTAT